MSKNASYRLAVEMVSALSMEDRRSIARGECSFPHYLTVAFEPSADALDIALALVQEESDPDSPLHNVGIVDFLAD